MLLDDFLIFSSEQAITATASSTNVVDLGAPKTPNGWTQALPRDIGKGRNLPLIIRVVGANFNTLTSLTATLQMDTVENFASPDIVATSGAIVLASLVVGYQFPIHWIIPGFNQRYMRLVYTVAGTDPTTGKIDAFIPASAQNWYTP